MAKFKNQHLKLKDNQRIYFGDDDDSSIYHDGTKLKVTTVISGVTPVAADDLATKYYVDVAAAGVSDHGSLTGLSDNDHPQYVLDTDFTTYSGDIISYVDTQDTALGIEIDGCEKYHGIEAVGTLSFNNATHVVSIAGGTNTYWYQGVEYTTALAIVCDLDDYVTLTSGTLYYVYFDDTSGTLKASDSYWDMHTKIPVATVFWNGSAGALSKETHSHTRDIDWHINAHLTIGIRYYTGLAQNAPLTSADSSIDIGAGTLYDEDLVITIPQTTNSRIFYLVSADTYTFVDSALPYAGTAGSPKFLNTSTYTLDSPTGGDFCVQWVYATSDIDRPIYIIPHAAAADFGSLALARAATPPALTGLGLSPEMKLIYRWIYRADGEYQEGEDYRNTSSLPAGGVASTTAAAVTFVPYGNIASTNVQSGMQELDDEKASLTFLTTVSGDILTYVSANYIDNSEMTTISGDIVAQFPSDFYTQAEITTISGDIIAQIPDVSDFITDAEVATISGDIIAQIPSDFYTQAEVDTISGALHAEVLAASGTTTFIGLTDTPANYTSSSGLYVKVKSTEDGLEFAAAGGGTFLSLTDTPAAYTSSAGKVVAVNMAADALEFVAAGSTNLDGGHADTVYGGTTALDGGNAASF